MYHKDIIHIQWQVCVQMLDGTVCTLKLENCSQGYVIVDRNVLIDLLRILQNRKLILRLFYNLIKWTLPTRDNAIVTKWRKKYTQNAELWQALNKVTSFALESCAVPACQLVPHTLCCIYWNPTSVCIVGIPS